jgi:hypothetical protein
MIDPTNHFPAARPSFFTDVPSERRRIMLELIIVFIIFIVALWLFLKMLIDMLRT